MQVKTYRVAFWRVLVRPMLKGALRALFHILAPVEMIGKENISYGQPYVAVMNHVSLFDPPFMLSFWPEMLESMGAVDIWHRPGQNVLVRLYGGIPVHRGEYDRQSLDTVLSVIRSGKPLLIAPEGGRSHAPGMRRAKPGVAYIVEETGVPVIPVGILGTTDDFRQKASKGNRPPLEMRIGKPIRLPPVEGKGAERRAARQRNADLVMSHIAGLLPEEYRGVYADSAISPAQAPKLRGQAGQ
ncbi:1-acyl-sn-glycerol-3-phosphate acyltransferase [bacterium]|nr:1-acyl-sn-glycerol-3-phosphate acyltransferase [bacterium]